MYFPLWISNVGIVHCVGLDMLCILFGHIPGRFLFVTLYGLCNMDGFVLVIRMDLYIHLYKLRFVVLIVNEQGTLITKYMYMLR